MNDDHDKAHLIGGFHAVMAAIEEGRPIRCLWLANARQDGRGQALMDAAAARDIELHQVGMSELDGMLGEVRHQGCIAELHALRTWQESELPELLAAQDRPWVLALDQIQDPHNLGACLRSAAAAGVTAVIAPRKRAAGLTAAVRKVAAGAAERVPFVAVTNLSRALDRLQKEGFWTVGLSAAATSSIYEAELPERIVWVAGGEANGLRELTLRHCDLQVAIPMAGSTESLNVSVATGIALFETLRLRGLVAARG